MNSNGPEPHDEGVRLQVWLARAGVASRRSAVEIIRNGRVKLNGKVTCEPGARVQPGDAVALDSRSLASLQKPVYYALHKPSKVLCSTADGDGRRALALDLVQPFVKERLFSVGRLDYMTSGLLLLTNDGDWAKHLAHPSSQVEKEYLVETKKEIPADLLEEFRQGIRVQGELFRCASYTLTGPHSLRLVLSEGKNREIRKVFLSRNITVRRVHRLRVGPVTLKGLEAGRFRKLSESEVRALRHAGPESHGHRD